MGTMSPKKITVVDASDVEKKEMLGSQDGYNRLLSRLGVACLVDGDGFNANDFDSLVDGGTYTLGQRSVVDAFVSLWFAETQQGPPLGHVVSIPNDKPYVGNFQKAVKAEFTNELSHCDAPKLAVLKPGVNAADVIDKYPVLDENIQPFDQILELGDGNSVVVIAPQQQENRKRKSHVLKLLATAQEVFSESGTRKSDRLARVKAHDDGSKTCFLCTSKANVEASHVVQKSDVSFRQVPDSAYETLEILNNWTEGRKWNRPFDMHGAMNLIWLCHTHNLQFDAHKFCIKIDMHNLALFHAFDESFDDLVAQANIRLQDPEDKYYDMAYVSRRAIGMRILQSMERGRRYIDHDNVDAWKAVVALSSAASVAAESKEETEESQDLEGFDGAAVEKAS